MGRIEIFDWKLQRLFLIRSSLSENDKREKPKTEKRKRNQKQNK